MGTPLKSLPALLSPRFLSSLSPLSPKLLSVPRKRNGFASLPKKSLGETVRAKPASKRLEFSQYSSPIHLVEHIQVNITDYSVCERELTSTKDILINSPNKRNIFENGIIGNKNHTVLGIGSFGKVIRGIHKGKTVAVKVVRNKANLSEKNALNLNHDNIVKTLDIIKNTEGKFSLIIMEYFPNSKQLQTVLEDRDYQIESNMISFAVDICKGLNFIHGKGILHLDIKPQNVLVAENVCKLCDFGNSVYVSEIENFNHQGTIAYTAPELLKGKPPNEKCDIYSLGILLWQLKSRIPPYSDVDNMETVIYKVVKCNWRPENTNPSDQYSKLYQTCWEMEPSKRPFVSNVLYTLREML